MKIAVYSVEPYDRQFLGSAFSGEHELMFFAERLSLRSVPLAQGAEAVCVFVNDDLGADVLSALQHIGVRLVVLRCAGFNNVDIDAAVALGIAVGRVPAYSPYAVAEHAVAMMLTLNRKTHRAHNRVREGNFELDGLLGFDLHGKTAGIVGTGSIGEVLARILTGFGCRVIAHDPVENQRCREMGVTYVSMDTLLADSDIISLQCPLTLETHHLIDERAISLMRPGVMLINTSRGAVVDTRALIPALKTGKIGSLGLDVYEEEAEVFFHDFSATYIPDDVLARLLTFHNVLITSHQAFFTREALSTIAATTLENVACFLKTGAPRYPVTDR